MTVMVLNVSNLGFGFTVLDESYELVYLDLKVWLGGLI
jgi:hypothetical protein